MAGRGTFSDLRSRLGVPKAPEVVEALSEPEQPSPLKTSRQAATQGKRKRRPAGAGESPEAGMVYAACLGAAFDLRLMIGDWRLGAPSALGLSKLLQRLEYLSERADYPVLHGYLLGGEEVFVMEFGCAVCWGCSRPTLNLIIDSLWPFLTSSRDKRGDVHVDDLFFTLPSGVETGEVVSVIFKDNIILSTDDLTERLAHAYAFAQSAKLDVFERGVARAIEGMDDYPVMMATTGALSMTDRRQVSKKIGELFVHGCDINLRSDVLEVPDILWDMDAVLPVYHASRKYLDIQARSAILNHRLGVMQEMYEMIQEELQFAESNRIEWIIIVLICVNVLIELGMMAIEWATAPID